MRQLLAWLLGRSSALGCVRPWNEAIAQRRALETEHMLLGWCGPVQAAPTAAQRARQRGQA